MARKPALSLETLTPLGAEKLARILLDEADANAALRKRVTAALAATQGPDALAKQIDRRLAALERARAVIPWEKERSLAEDLDATVKIIAGEVLPLDPARAVACLLRFVDTHGRVFDRIDDSSGRIQEVYWRATQALPGMVEKLPAEDAAQLPGRLLLSLERDTHGLAVGMAKAVVPLLPVAELAAWDRQLAQQEKSHPDVLEIRQAIADARGDLDGYLAVEARRPEWRQDPLAAAERLLAAGRLPEALEWCRRERKGGLIVVSAADLAEGRMRPATGLERARLEARILEAMKDRPAAQALRWATFERSLDADILRDYLGKLDDFVDEEERSRAFAFAASCPQPYSALAFFLAWPELERAARLVLDRRAEWDGRHYDLLGSAAATLEFDFPLAATVLYRALLADILGRGKSQAYRHGVRYLAKLAELAERLPPGASDLPDHDAYCADIKKAHGRKSGFWALVDSRSLPSPGG